MKFDTAILLGAGGMGEVYRAFDPALKRDVALKFIRGDNPAMVERLLREARLQALVDHDHVCKVYEVGEADGRPYIAMQFVEGEGLGRASEQMSLRQKAEVMKDVAEAVHAAHRVGLIHRDLKPGNVLVERKEGGALHAWVLDFGLAREAEAPGLTESGVALGTPSFMAPEQARGEVHLLDRRTDVYALGAVLYAILTRKAPFEGKSSVEILIRVLNEEPVPPRKLDPEIPSDLETIVLKCLEKEPARRYDTARAVAADLGNYLDGEPLLARPVSAGSRIARRIRKNRAAVTASMAALAVITALGVMWLRARWESEERALLAQRFGQEVERIDGVMREAHLLPLHDIGPDKDQVRDRTRSIEAEMKRIGEPADGPGHYALGRGHMALQEFEAARSDLEAAWGAGYRPAEAAYALGQTLGVLYQKELHETLKIGLPALRESRRRDVERRLREPALLYLREARRATGIAPGYVEALVAYYEKRYDEALEAARAAAGSNASLYEARKLQGDILVVLGILDRKKGDYSRTADRFGEAAEPYRLAMETGRSDPAVYESECYRWLNIAGLARERGGTVSPAGDRALAACGKAHEADPQSLAAYNQEAQIHLLRAEEIRGAGGDPLPEISRVIDAAKAGVAQDSRDAESYKNIGQGYSEQAQEELWHGKDLSGSIALAVENLERSVALDRSSLSTWVILGTVYETKAQSEVPRGIDPKPSLELAIRSYRSAVAIEPGFAFEYNNIGNCYWYEAAYEISKGRSPEASLDAALRSYRQAVAVDENYFLSHHNVGYALQSKADDAVARGADPRGFLEEALASYRKAANLNPKYADAWKDSGVALASMAEYLLGRGDDPLEKAAEGERMLRTAASIDPRDFEIDLTVARVAMVRARWALEHGTSPAAPFDAARAALGRSLKLNPSAAVTHQVYAEWRLRRAEWLLGRKAPAGEDLQEGIAEAATALSINPESGEALAIRGSLRLLQAQTAGSGAPGAEAAKQSVADFVRAFEVNPLLERRYGTLLARAQRAAGPPPAAAR